MSGRYSSRATKFLYLDGARMTGADGPLTKSESETEYLTEKFIAGRIGPASGRSIGTCERHGLA